MFNQEFSDEIKSRTNPSLSNNRELEVLWVWKRQSEWFTPQQHLNHYLKEHPQMVIGKCAGSTTMLKRLGLRWFSSKVFMIDVIRPRHEMRFKQTREARDKYEQ